MNRLLFLWSYLADSKGRFAAALGLLTLVSATSLVYPWLLKLMVDAIQRTSPDPAATASLALVLLVLLAVSTVVGYRQQLILQSIGFRLRNALREDFFTKLLARPMAFHRQQQLGELSARLAEDIGRVQTLPASFVAPLFQNTLFILGCVGLMAALNISATLLVLPLLLLPMPVIALTSRAIRSSSARSQTLHASASALFEESLGGIREIKAMASEVGALRRYRAILSEAFTSELSAARQNVIVNQSVYFLLSFLLLGIFYLGSAHAFFREWSVGSVIAFYFYAYTLSMALISQARLLVSHQSILGAIDRVIEVLAPGDSPLARGGNHEASLQGAVRFDDVSFSYAPERPVFRALSFAVPRDVWCVVTGPSGSGKSTLAHLLLGLDRPVAGRVLLDEVPVEAWTQERLLRQIGFVGQEPTLFHGTIRENISAARPEMSRGEIDTLVRLCCLEDFVSSLPKRLDTIIGERGYALSGGQRSRIALARALAVDPSLLILDEATAMLEPGLEEQIWRNLAALRARRATVILTHHPEQIPAHAVTLRIDLAGTPP